MASLLETVSSNLVALREARNVASAYAEEIHRHFADRVRDVYLYGSAARGDWSPESDVDVLIVLDDISDEDTEWLVSRAVALGVLSSGFLLQPVFLTSSDFDDLRRRERRYALDVLREGVRL